MNLQIMGQDVSLIAGEGFTPDQWDSLTHIWSRAFVEKVSDAKTLKLNYGEAPADADYEKELWSTSLANLEEVLSTRLTLAGIDHNKGQRLMMHACGFSNEDGEVIAFVAQSGTGKTTLAKTLGPKFGYVSDETVVIDFDLTVHPYPKPLSVIVEKGKPKVQMSPDDLGLKVPRKELKLHKIVLLNRDKEPVDTDAPATMEEVPLIESIMKLTPELSYMAEVDKPLQRLAQTIEKTGGVIQVNYVESKTLLPLIEKLFQ